MACRLLLCYRLVDTVRWKEWRNRRLMMLFDRLWILLMLEELAEDGWNG